MTKPARPDPARTASRNGHVRPGPGAVRAVGLLPGWTVVSAALSPVLVTAGWLVADAVQPAAYDPVRATVSVMAGYAGTDRWIMTAALLLVGGCQLLTAAGLAGVRVPARVVLAIAGLSSIGIAVSPEPVRGSTPQHVAWTALGAVAIAVWPAFVARHAAPRPLILGRSGCAVATVVFLVLLGWLVIETQGGSDLGLAERLSVSTETCWPFVVAVILRQTTRGSVGLPLRTSVADGACRLRRRRDARSFSMLGSGRTGAVRALAAAGSPPSGEADLYRRYAAGLCRQALLTRGDPEPAGDVVYDVIVNECALARLRERGEDDARYRLGPWARAVRRPRRQFGTD